MTDKEAFRYVKYLAVGAGTLTAAQKERLSESDKGAAIEIMDHRLGNLEGNRNTGLWRS